MAAPYRELQTKAHQSDSVANPHTISFLLERDCILFEQGSPADRLYVVNSGIVFLRHVTDEGHNTITDVIRRKGILGVESFANGQPYHTSAIAAEDSNITAIEIDALKDLIAEKPNFAIPLLKAISDAYLNLTEHLVITQNGQSTQRVAKTIAEFTNDQGEAHVTHRTVGERAGLNRVWATKAITQLRKRGALENGSPFKGTLNVRNHELLQTIASTFSSRRPHS